MPIIRKLLQSTLGGDCPDDTLVLKRYTEDSVLQVSTDGGETWKDAPYLDPRIISPVFPDAEGYTKCDYATVYIGWLQLQVINPVADTLSTGATIALIIGIIGAAIILLLVTGGLAGLAIPAAIELAAYLLTVTSTELTESFDTDTMKEIVCLLYCHMSENGTLTEQQHSEMTADVDIFITDVVARITMKGIFVLCGNVGTTNAMHSEALANPGMHAPAGYCDDCECGCDLDLWQVWDGLGGAVETGTDGEGKYVQCVAIQDDRFGGGAWGFVISTMDADLCCEWVGEADVVGGTNVTLADACGTAIPGTGGSIPGGAGHGSQINLILFASSSGAFTKKVYFA